MVHRGRIGYIGLELAAVVVASAEAVSKFTVLEQGAGGVMVRGPSPDRFGLLRAPPLARWEE